MSTYSHSNRQPTASSISRQSRGGRYLSPNIDPHLHSELSASLPKIIRSICFATFTTSRRDYEDNLILIHHVSVLSISSDSYHRPSALPFFGHTDSSSGSHTTRAPIWQGANHIPRGGILDESVMPGHIREISDSLTITETEDEIVTTMNRTTRYSKTVPVALICSAESIYLLQNHS